MKGLTVTGTGSARAVPDLATLTVALEGRAAAAAAAFDAASAAASTVLAAVASFGVPPADTATSALTLSAETSWREGEGQRITGYTASSQLTIALREAGRLSALLAVLVAAGGDALRIHALEFGVADTAALLAQARDAAWRDALAKAGHYARLAHRELGPVLSMTEQAGPPPPVFLRAARESGPDVVPGVAQVEATVQVRWALVSLVRPGGDQ